MSRLSALAAHPRRTGKANAVPATVALGSFAASAKHQYKFDVTLPSSTANAFQGAGATFQFDWKAAS